MKNALRVLARDVKRLLHAPIALLVLVALLVLPSAYSWYNVKVFWDPYGNTGNLQVSVVNEDAGAETDALGTLNVGNSICEKLQENTKLKWVFEDEESAEQHLNAGESYAVFVIPADFTENLLSVATGDYTQPTITYLVNEKLGAVSPKVTDQGKTTLEQTVNSTFVGVVTDVAVEAMNNIELPSTDETKANVIAKLEAAQSSISDVRTAVTALDSKLAVVQQQRETAVKALDALSTDFGSASTTLQNVSGYASTVQGTLQTMAPELSQAVTESIEVLSELEPIAELRGYGEEYQAALDGLKSCQDAVFAQMIPTTATGLGRLSSSASSLGTAASSAQTLMGQAKSLLTELDDAISTTREALSKTDTLLSDVSGDLDLVKTDISALSLSSALSELSSQGTVNAASIAAFMASPTVVRTEKLYQVESYGVGVAPMFMNLTFWIGAFMLLLVFKLTKDNEGVPGLREREHYVGRYLLFCIPVVLQAIICCAGLMVLGVTPAQPVAFFLGSIFIALCYSCIIYALVSMFQHVGLGLAMALVFIQLPSASGMYPVEMLASFYSAICPLFPFTYGIAALREALCGFYGYTFPAMLGMVALFGVGFFLTGFILAPFLTNAKRAVGKQIAASGLLNGGGEEEERESVSKGQLLERLTHGDSFKNELGKQLHAFEKRYPHMVRYALALGIGAALVVGIIGLVLGADRSILLTFWLVCYLVLFIFFAVLVSLRSRLYRLLALGEMTDVEVAGVFDSLNKRAARRQAAADAVGNAMEAMAQRVAGDAASASDADDAPAAEDAEAEADAPQAVAADASNPEEGGGE